MFMRIPQVVAIQACDNNSLPIIVSCFTAEVIKIFKELSLINSYNVQLPGSIISELIYRYASWYQSIVNKARETREMHFF